MSLADKASLLLIPTGYKSQKVYSIFPTDGVGDFDFSRSSSATRIAKNGLITTVAANVPRLEYPMIDGVVNGCPSLKLEPQRTNLLAYSEDFSNAYWSTNSNALISLSSNLSPDGTANAYRIEAVTGTQVGYVGTTTIGTTITHSIWVRRISGSTTFNMVDVNNNNTSVNITSDWQRFSVTSTATSTNLRNYFRTTALGDVVEIYGAQTEEGSYPTSYIKSNSGYTTTRSAETCNGAGDAATFNDSEGVLMAEISALADDGTVRSIAISGSVTNDVVRFYYDGVSNGITAFVYNGAYQSVFTTVVNDITENNKIAFSYKLNEFKLFINGLQVGVTDTNGAIPNGLDGLKFDNGYGAEDFYGNTKQLQYYNSALTDSELEKISSWTSFTDMAQGQLYTIE